MARIVELRSSVVTDWLVRLELIDSFGAVLDLLSIGSNLRSWESLANLLNEFKVIIAV